MRMRERFPQENDSETTVYYTFSHPKFGDLAAMRGVDGKGWICARDYIDGYAGAATGGLLSGLGSCSEETARRVFSVVPDRFKAVKRFHTPEGFQDLLGITAEGLRFFHDHNDRNDDGPGLRLVE